MLTISRMLARKTAVLGIAVVALFVAVSVFAGPIRAQQMVASWYGIGDGFAGLTTANGETFDPYEYTAAHKTLPFGTKLAVTYEGRTVVVRINDRGPYIQGRDLDLSYAAADYIGLVAAGSAPVNVEYVDPSTPVGPYQAQAAAPAPEPAPVPGPAPEPEPAPATVPETQPESEPVQVQSVPEPAPAPASEPAESAQEPGFRASQALPGGPAGIVGLAQYAGEDQYEVAPPVEETPEQGQQAAADQYVDEDQYEAEEPVQSAPVQSAPEQSQQIPADQYVAGDQYAGEDQYDDGAGQGPSGPAATPPAEPAPQQEAPQQPSPATVPSPPGELQEPPAELVKPGSTVEHRIEIHIAATIGSATQAPDTPDLAPAPVDLQAQPEEGAEPAPAQSEDGARDHAETAEDGDSAGEQAEGEQDSGDIEIERLPDTGGWIGMPGLSLADVAAVLLVAAVLKAGLRWVRP